MDNETIKFIIIKTKEQGIFISDNVDGKSYFSSKIPDLFFDGEKLVATFRENWYKLSKLPQKIEKQGADSRINERYELKESFPVSDLTPKIIQKENWDSDSEIIGLYLYRFDVVKGQMEDVEFELEILSEEDNFYVERPRYKSTPSLMSSLTVHPALHSERPCSISGKDLYEIVRNHIKLNINPKYARVTSDYNFCFTVKKIISHEPESYVVDTGTKRKSRYETRYRRLREVVIFETSPEVYNNYPVQKGLHGENQQDLEDKIENYLEETLNLINKPYIECECCKGLGVIIDKNGKNN